MTSLRAPTGASRSTDSYSFRCYTGRTGLGEIAGAWRELAASLPRRWFHHLPEWYDSQLDALESDDSAVGFHAGHRGGELQAIIPLKATRLRVMGTRVAVLTLPFDDHLPFGDIVSRPGTDIASLGTALLEHLQRAAGVSWDLLVLPRVLSGAAACELIEGVDARRVASHAQGHCDFMSCADAAAADNFVSGKLRRDLRRRGNKLRQLGAVEHVVTTGGAGLGEAYERFLAVEASGWKGVGGAGTAIALHPRYVALYRALLDRFAAFGGAEISELRVAGRSVAAQFALVVDGAWYLMKTGYDESLSAMAPGNLLFERTLERLAADPQVTEINLVSDAGWHRTWNPDRVGVTTHFIANRTLRGLATVALLRLKERVHDRKARRAASDVTGDAPGDLPPDGTRDGAPETAALPTARDARRRPAGIHA